MLVKDIIACLKAPRESKYQINGEYKSPYVIRHKYGECECSNVVVTAKQRPLNPNDIKYDLVTSVFDPECLKDTHVDFQLPGAVTYVEMTFNFIVKE